MGLFDLVREEQEAKKKAEESAKKDTKDAVVEEVEKVEEDKKEEKPAGKKVPKKKASTEKTYKYPFGVYSEGRLIDISSYGFVDGQDYTEKEITDIMLQHRHYEFAGTMEYSYIEDDNVLVVTGKQHRKG
ncbi:hypothetical protein [Faecalibacillus intestinalis]|uniref:hypothetical protein n=1 Tax=Faecalibacillus intestinalis TaxID=1982626 RepID=UPI0035209B83